MTSEPVHFYGRNKPFNEFSNFHEAPIELDGYTWPTTEHYFQAQKFVHDQEHYLHVLNLPAPRAAFNYVRTYKSFVRPDWADVKDEVMLKACMAKFGQHKELKDLLLSTGDRLLVEHTENDSYWGDGGDGSGRNQLGITLMKNGFSTEIHERVAAFGDAGGSFAL
ncbi:unnamed protein product [Adineta ricciae]|uniref:NADAR domain-containing protein n=1 Tax=Adineta ricciae TaxID=249248 RepID=A0A815HCX4_ADIRI|nr:unnamed protein product [Adineta ricciae]